MNSQHYFKKLDKFAVCAFQAQKGCIEVELKSESCGIYHYVFYGSAKHFNLSLILLKREIFLI